MSQYFEPVNTNLIEVPVGALTPGMFVSQLDRPWLETPFAMQGFVIRDKSDAEYVATHCNFVYVDPHKKVRAKDLPKNRKPTRSVADRVPLKTEFSQAKIDFESASDVIADVFSKIKSNRRVDLVALQSAINPLIDSVLRNSDALAALIRMKRKGDYFFNHSLATAVWAVVLGRHMGLKKPVLQQLALGTSIMDVGMADISNKLLNNTQVLAPHEIAEIRKHVPGSIKLVQASGTASAKVLNIIACHHERYDGSGYPQRLKGSAIPMLARIAGIADAYDAMITSRPHSPARSSFDAIQELSDTKGMLFQASLVEHFIQTVGMFPTGTVVELNTGEVGVVVEQNSTRRLRPKLVLILDAEKRKRDSLTVVDLSRYDGGDNSTSTYWIAKELEVGAFGISPDDYFL